MTVTIIITQLQIDISPGVNMTFINNHAAESGGGIFVEFPAIRYTTSIFNRHCFLQYNHPTEGRDIPPQEWKVNEIIPYCLMNTCMNTFKF